MKLEKSKIHKIVLFLTHLLCSWQIFSQEINLIKATDDLFVKFQDKKSSLECQGILVGYDKILTSAKCFCHYEPKILGKMKATINVTTVSSVENYDKELQVEVYRHDLSCRQAILGMSEANERYDRNYFDIAVLKIIRGREYLIAPTSYPKLKCTYPQHNQLVMNGYKGIIGKENPLEVFLGIHQFALNVYPNYWSGALQMYSSGYRNATLSDFFGLNDHQDGSSLLSHKIDLKFDDINTRSTTMNKLQDLIISKKYEKLNVVGISTRGIPSKDPNLLLVRGNLFIPLFNVKKFLKKQFENNLEALSSECLNVESPSGFDEEFIEIH